MKAGASISTHVSHTKWMDLMKYNGKVNGIVLPWTGFFQMNVNIDLCERYGIKSPVDYFKEGNWNWTTMKTFFEERDENEAYRHMRRRLRRVSRRMRPFFAKVREVFVRIWGKIVIALKTVLSFFKTVWRFISAPFKKLREKFKKNNKKR